ncbi:MAG: VOC family protein [Burkholderiaceae bacterium]|nr:VOC family protein [Burkholderiaceae bacterium]
MNTLGWQELKVVALAVDDLARAADFYRTRLGLEPRPQADGDVGFALGGLTILLKPLAGLGSGAEKSPYPRLTIAVADAPRMERDLAARGVAISDAVQRYDDGCYWVGAFLDSEGNKLWFCSEAKQPAPRA